MLVVSTIYEKPFFFKKIIKTIWFLDNVNIINIKIFGEKFKSLRSIVFEKQLKKTIDFVKNWFSIKILGFS